MIRLHIEQHGGVSLFIVIFTALLVTIAATGYVQIMAKGQEASTNNDLSQRAYDSALAGVEDAKRALIKFARCSATAGCNTSAMQTAFDSNRCDTLAQGAIGVASARLTNTGEEPVGDGSQNQAYTCVKIELESNSVVDDLATDGSVTVKQLKSTDEFSKVRISWFTQADLPPGAAIDFFEDTDGNKTGLSLPPEPEQWGENSPPLLRLELLPFANSPSDRTTKDLDALDKLTRTLFLYPVASATTPAPTNTLDFDNDDQRQPNHKNNPQAVLCETTFNAREYACSAVIDLPNALAASEKPALLGLTTIYNRGQTHFKIELLDTAPGNNVAVVPFNGVQPVVDSTGRAGDLYRRVRANVTVAGIPDPYPNATLNVLGNLCKDFFITNDYSDYLPNTDGTTCEP